MVVSTKIVGLFIAKPPAEAERIRSGGARLPSARRAQTGVARARLGIGRLGRRGEAGEGGEKGGEVFEADHLEHGAQLGDGLSFVQQGEALATRNDQVDVLREVPGDIDHADGRHGEIRSRCDLSGQQR